MVPNIKLNNETKGILFNFVMRTFSSFKTVNFFFVLNYGKAVFSVREGVTKIEFKY